MFCKRLNYDVVCDARTCSCQARGIERFSDQLVFTNGGWGKGWYLTVRLAIKSQYTIIVVKNIVIGLFLFHSEMQYHIKFAHHFALILACLPQIILTGVNQLRPS